MNRLQCSVLVVSVTQIKGTSGIAFHVEQGLLIVSFTSNVRRAEALLMPETLTVHVCFCTLPNVPFCWVLGLRRSMLHWRPNTCDGPVEPSSIHSYPYHLMLRLLLKVRVGFTRGWCRLMAFCVVLNRHILSIWKVPVFVNVTDTFGSIQRQRLHIQTYSRGFTCEDLDRIVNVTYNEQLAANSGIRSTVCFLPLCLLFVEGTSKTLCGPAPLCCLNDLHRFIGSTSVCLN